MQYTGDIFILWIISLNDLHEYSNISWEKKCDTTFKYHLRKNRWIKCDDRVEHLALSKQFVKKTCHIKTTAHQNKIAEAKTVAPTTPNS